MEPLVSILIPAFNAERWIGATIESALGQTWSGCEIIVVDDGSSDNTAAVARRYEAENVTVISGDNRGACAARNHAFEVSKGDLIQWLDADDLLGPDKIALQVNAWRETGEDSRVVFSGEWGRFYHRPKSAKLVPSALWVDLDPCEWLIRRVDKPNMMPNHCWLVSRELSEEIGGWNESLRRNQDGEYFTRVVASSRLVKFVEGARCYYRMGNAGSISGDVSTAAKESLYEAILLCHEELLELEDSPRARRACAGQLQRYLSSRNLLTPSLAEKCRARIRELGGEEEPVKQPWKRVLLNKALGEGAAERLKNRFWRANRRMASSWERILASLPGGNEF